MKWSSDSGYVLDPGLVAIACQQHQHSTVTDQFCDKRCLLTSSEKDVIQIWYAIYNIHTNNMIFFMMSRANWGKVPFAHFHERVLQNSEVGKLLNFAFGRYWVILLRFKWSYSNVQFWMILLKCLVLDDFTQRSRVDHDINWFCLWWEDPPPILGSFVSHGHSKLYFQWLRTVYTLFFRGLT